MLTSFSESSASGQATGRARLTRLSRCIGRRANILPQFAPTDAGRASSVCLPRCGVAVARAFRPAKPEPALPGFSIKSPVIRNIRPRDKCRTAHQGQHPCQSAAICAHEDVARNTWARREFWVMVCQISLSLTQPPLPAKRLRSRSHLISNLTGAAFLSISQTNTEKSVSAAGPAGRTSPDRPRLRPAVRPQFSLQPISRVSSASHPPSSTFTLVRSIAVEVLSRFKIPVEPRTA